MCGFILNTGISTSVRELFSQTGDIFSGTQKEIPPVKGVF